MRRLFILLVTAAVLTTLALWPTSSYVGVNYQVTPHPITLFEKAVGFIDRDLRTRRLVAEITRGSEDSEETLVRLFQYSCQHVVPTPPGLPIIDDHPLHILLRGYGAPDQQTEAFALLASYAGFPAAAYTLTGSHQESRLVALVRLEKRLLVFDPVQGKLFRDSAGHLLDFEQLHRDPTQPFFSQTPPLGPSFGRMEDQKPLARLWRQIVNFATK